MAITDTLTSLADECRTKRRQREDAAVRSQLAQAGGALGEAAKRVRTFAVAVRQVQSRPSPDLESALQGFASRLRNRVPSGTEEPVELIKAAGDLQREFQATERELRDAIDASRRSMKNAVARAMLLAQRLRRDDVAKLCARAEIVLNESFGALPAVVPSFEHAKDLVQQARAARAEMVASLGSRAAEIEDFLARVEEPSGFPVPELSVELLEALTRNGLTQELRIVPESS